MNLQQYRDLLQDLLDDVDRIEKSLGEMRNLQAYAQRKIDNQNDVDRYRDILNEARQDLKQAEAEADELRSLMTYVQRKLGDAIKQTPSGSIPTRSRQRPTADQPARETPPQEFSVKGRTRPPSQQRDDRSSITPRTRAVPGQVIDDGSDDSRPIPQPVVEPEAEKEVDRSAQTVAGIVPVVARPAPAQRVSSSKETIESDGDIPVVPVKPIRVPEALKASQNGKTSNRVPLDGPNIKGTVEFGMKDGLPVAKDD